MAARPATALELARYGHIAAFLRQQMEERGLKRPVDLNQLLGLDRGNTLAHKWLNGFGAPTKKNRALLAKKFGTQADFFLPRTGKAPTEQLPVVRQVAASARVPEVLSFAVQADGTARIRLDVTLPIEQGAPLLRMLLDAGLVIGHSTSDLQT